MSKISVIVPIYNVEPYIHQCVDSIINQTYKDLEIILVDDGSPDNCGKICDEYAAKDDRVKVIHRPNGGLSAARNSGLDVATGEYIAFVDSDDYIACNMYSDMMEFMLKHKLDIVVCSSYRVKNSKIKEEKYTYEEEILLKPEFMPKALTTSFIPAWNKLYKADVVGDIRYPVGRKFEDSATTYLMFEKANIIGVLDIPYYYYRVNENSITQTSYYASSRWDYVLGYIERLDFVEKKYPELKNECISLLIKAVLSCLTTIYACPKGNDWYYQQCKNIMNKYKDYNDIETHLNGKYRLYLANFYDREWILKLCAKMS